MKADRQNDRKKLRPQFLYESNRHLIFAFRNPDFRIDSLQITVKTKYMSDAQFRNVKKRILREKEFS
ncbi:hypothetical protein LEP1GSC036_1159 [Leptospira weilii str. 2006001853]|uniref:Uncharacterized protein n=4 Tax=Leptospira weilii TaxID=28184 RepID=A0A828Z1I1_9LEPT|nr:hypothetical protein LEP1GSC036_1159 [Leptospira weilii str. 2006001853]EMJ64744.1 hypothetical protein LEP1GSC051_3284 [Leptospira sp. P2653]EMM70610.1 hypothetical protein LEP1GSC038_1235 [Leptospira weilii str. 2006001855]EMN89817.1 hypothetical protein LEP1GSC108_2669 [Leptospira weilii str. UI 13098]EMY13883.1 hypothetical protein LEP1GSC043_3302 [Leptospira weilii str. Ecochallenge]QDK23504.1 hypothetical protein FHG67_12810 [Leptospira weilii]